jgi:hypothetical protein
MKTQVINTPNDANRLFETVEEAASSALGKVADARVEGDMAALWRMKFEPLGFDPIDGTSRLNLIEQINQSFTYLTSALAVKLLFYLHPDLAPFTLNLGTAAGSDIESLTKPGLAAEVFAATSPSSNQKLKKDIEKVGKAEAKYKYVFFMSPGYQQGRQKILETDGQVQVWGVGGRDEL